MHSPLLFTPSTPTRRSYEFSSCGYQPVQSSPLASSPSSPKSSPAAAAQARRRAQYKSLTLSSPTHVRTRHIEQRRASMQFEAGNSNGSSGMQMEEAPRKAFLRERLRARCIERAVKDRERKLKGRRMLDSEPSSDGADEMMDDEDEDDDAIINDELFRRIIANTRRKEQHGYRLSYAYDVGSSFDPDMEDVNEWETDLQGPEPSHTVPEDLEEEELATYAEEYDLHLEDLRAEDIFSLSDLDYYPVAGEDEDAPTDHEGMDKDVEMA